MQIKSFGVSSNLDKKNIFSIISQVCKNNELFKNKNDDSTNDLDIQISDKKIMADKLKVLLSSTSSNHEAISNRFNILRNENDDLRSIILNKLGDIES